MPSVISKLHTYINREFFKDIHSHGLLFVCQYGADDGFSPDYKGR